MKLKAMAWATLSAGLMLHATSSQAGSCRQSQLNETSCQQNQTVRCVKHFQPAGSKFIYKWEFVNDSGQVFEAPTNMLGKTPGYTPKMCGLKRDVVAELVGNRPIYRN